MSDFTTGSVTHLFVKKKGGRGKVLSDKTFSLSYSYKRIFFPLKINTCLCISLCLKHWAAMMALINKRLNDDYSHIYILCIMLTFHKYKILYHRFLHYQINLIWCLFRCAVFNIYNSGNISGDDKNAALTFFFTLEFLSWR